ncbi:MAG: hypothetical protein CL489_08720 [Acidobacteria bacterium]|nr:hypothetical protein [Acidobacteriota bacterium]
MTNGLDGHIKNGNPEEPIKVALPNKLYPQFTVRDYGTGMEHDFIMNEYSSYFKSTKDDSNDEVGGHGLGCKSPFAYTSSFTVKSYQNGVLRVYSCYMKANGEPSIDFQLETRTDERNGVEVSVPVEENDFNRFENEAAYVISTFDVKPDINVNPKFEMEHFIDSVYVTDVSLESKVMIRMGNVIYPLSNNDDIRDVLWKTNFRSKINKTIIIDMPIGEVPVAVSRENIEYEPWVVEHICEYINKLDERIDKMVDDLYQSVVDDENGYDIMKEKMPNCIDYYKKREFICPIPYTRKHCGINDQSGHYHNLMKSPISMLERIMNGEQETIYDTNKNKEFSDIDAESEPFYTLFKAYNSFGNKRNIYGRPSLATTVNMPNVYTDWDKFYLLERNAPIKRSIENNMCNDYTHYGNYFIIDKKVLDEHKKLIDFMFDNRVEYMKLVDKNKVDKIPRTYGSYNIYAVKARRYSLDKKTRDKAVDLEDALNSLRHSDFSFDGKTVVYCEHKSGGVYIDGFLSKIGIEKFSRSLNDIGVTVVGLPKCIIKQIKEYDGDYKFVHLKYVILGIVNNLLKRSRKIISVKATPLKYLDQYKGVDVNKFKYKMKCISDLSDFKYDWAFCDKPMKKKIIKMYKNINNNDEMIKHLNDKLIEEHPVLEYVEVGINDERDFKKIIKGMINE